MSRPSSSSKFKDSIVYNIFTGDFRRVPEPIPNTIKIFLSSTTKDYRLERDFIIETIYSELREYFKKQYGFDFTLIDLRWGIRREQALSNTTTQFCINEAKKCLKESAGPAFIAFLSERYGTALLREEIEKNEFETILEHAVVVNHDGVNLIMFAYELDENDLRECKYKLKSMKRILEELPSLKQKDEKRKSVWDKKEPEMIKSIRDAAKQYLPENQNKKYFISVTEEEIETGIIANVNADETSLAFFRKIIYTENDKEDMTKKGYLDEKAEYGVRLEEIKKKVEKKLSHQNRDFLEIYWSKTNALDKLNEYTKHYLDQFRTRLTVSIGGLIQNGVQRLANSQRNKLPKDDIEIIHHALLCNNLSKNFIERDEYTQKIKGYVHHNRNRRPFVIYGPSGTGKSSIIANIIRKLRKSNRIIAVRFMGTSRQSSNMYSVLKSLIYQFKMLFSLKEEVELKDPITARDYLFDKILTEENTKGRKVIILLDSIDQLHESDYTLSWMIYNLPRKVKVIYSTLPEHGSILQRIKEKLDFNGDNYLEILDLKLDEAIEQLRRNLGSFSRNLQPKQWDLVKSCLRTTPKIYPLHIKLLFDITVKWISTESESLERCISIASTIDYLFKRHELHFGPVMLSHFVFYLSIFKNAGVSESELEDVLSLDDQVLSEVFDKHEPPVRRFPNSILVRLLDVLKGDYLTEKQSDDTLVLSWFHRSFFEVSHEIYFHLLKGPSQRRDVLLENIIDYFMEKWRVQPKEYDWSGGKKAAPRYTRSQEMRSTKEDGSIVYNKRKLNEFLNIVLLLNNCEKKIEYLTDEIYLNYQFMHSKAKLKDLDFLIDTHSQIVELHDTQTDMGIKAKAKELLEVSSIFLSQYGAINECPDMIPVEVISRVGCHLAEKMMKSIGRDFALIPLPSGFQFTNERVLFVRDDKTKYIYVNWMYKSPYLLVRCEMGKQRYKIKLLNFSTSKHLNGEVDLPDEIKCEFLNKTPKGNIVDINELDGGVIYFEDTSQASSIFLKSFQNENFKIKTCEQCPQDIQMISSKHLLIVYDDSFEILNLTDCNNPIVSFASEVYEEEDFYIQTTSPDTKKEVIMPEHDRIENTILCVIFKKRIKVFDFDKMKNTGKELIQIDFDYEIAGVSVETGCLIDRHFTSESILNDNRIYSMKCSNEVCRIFLYAGIENGFESVRFINDSLKLSVINIFKNKMNETECEIVDIKQNINYLLKEEKPDDEIEIFDFFFNLLIFGIRYRKDVYRYRYMCLYDTSEYLASLIPFLYFYKSISINQIEQKKILRKIEDEEIIDEIWDGVLFLSNDKNKVIFQSAYLVCVYDVDTASIAKRYSFKNWIVDCKLIGDDTLLYSSGREIKSILLTEMLNAFNNQNKRNQLLNIGGWGSLYGFIDEEHIIVNRRKEQGDSGEMLIFNVKKQETVHSVSFIEPKKIVFNKKMIIEIPVKNGSLNVYSIKQSIGVTEINQIEKIECNAPVKCQCTNNQNQFLIHDFNKHENLFRIRKFELNINANRIVAIKEFNMREPNFKWRKYIDYKNEEAEEVLYDITHSNNHLVYLHFVSEEKVNEHYSNCTYELNCVNIETMECIQKSNLNKIMNSHRKLDEILRIPNEDDFIIYAEEGNSLAYCKINSNSELTKTEIRLDGGIRHIGVLSEELFYVNTHRTSIYDTKKLNRIHLFEFGRASINSKYLILVGDELLRVFELNNLKKEILTLHVGIKYSNNNNVVIMNDKYVALKWKNELLSLSFQGEVGES